MVMIECSQNGHTLWLEFKRKSVHVGNIASPLVEVNVNESDVIRKLQSLSPLHLQARVDNFLQFSSNFSVSQKRMHTHTGLICAGGNGIA